MYNHSVYTKKKLKPKTKDKIKELWNKFDKASNKIEKKKHSEDEGEKIECIYSTSMDERTNCDYCNYPVQVTDIGFLSCTNTKCGILFKDYLDRGAEWRYYGGNDSGGKDPTRCGMPVSELLEKSSYGCKVMTNSKSSYKMRKIGRYTEWQAMPHVEKTRYDDFEFIKNVANNAGIPKIIIDDALRYHKKISQQKTFRSLNRDGIIAASIYIAARMNKYPRTAKEIATIFHLDNTSTTRGCKNAITIINKLENSNEDNDKTKLCVMRPISFIERYCSKLNINKELTMLCKFVANKIEKKHLIPENTPHSVAAGIVYFVAQSCNLNISKKNVHGCSEISEVTINKCYKKLDKHKKDLIPSIILNKYAE